MKKQIYKNSAKSFSYASIGFEFIFIFLFFIALAFLLITYNPALKKYEILFILSGTFLGFFFAIFHLYRRVRNMTQKDSDPSFNQSNGKSHQATQENKQLTLRKEIETLHKRFKKIFPK